MRAYLLMNVYFVSFELLLLLLLLTPTWFYYSHIILLEFDNYLASCLKHDQLLSPPSRKVQAAFEEWGKYCCLWICRHAPTPNSVIFCPCGTKRSYGTLPSTSWHVQLGHFCLYGHKWGWQVTNHQGTFCLTEVLQSLPPTSWTAPKSTLCHLST